MSYPPGDAERERVAHPDVENVWMRGLTMLLIMVCFGLAQSVLYASAVIQFVWMVVTRERNVLLADFGRSLGLWMAESAWFLSGDSDDKPFPWKAWPRS
jgi:hypothetical protein